MGYTHYWDNVIHSDEQWDKITADTNALFKLASDSGIALAMEYDEPNSAPEANSEIIHFNGVEDDGHETMVIARNDTEWTFCKTAFKPYDAVVVALFCIIHHHNNDFEWSSDGMPDDHKEGLDLAKRVNEQISSSGLRGNEE